MNRPRPVVATFHDLLATASAWRWTFGYLTIILLVLIVSQAVE